MENECGAKLIRNNGLSPRSSVSNGGPDGTVDVLKDLKEANDLIEVIVGFSGFRKTQSKECLNLVRRLKMLAPLLEEIRDLYDMVPAEGLSSHIGQLKEALLLAKRLLKNCHNGSKIYLAFDNEAVMARFHAVYDKLKEALDGIPYDELGVSVELKEQVELMSTQLKRAKCRKDTQDMELAMDMMVVFSKNDERNADPVILGRLANKLELHKVADLEAETEAIQKLVQRRCVSNPESLQQIMELLCKFKKIAGMENSVASGAAPVVLKRLQRCRSTLIPHEFLCPISLEVMTDPVIVATGQTYDRDSIQTWLNSNHQTCPKTGQTLVHLSLAPNYALKNLILQWCQKHDYELPKKEVGSGFGDTPPDLAREISSLVHNLSSSQLDVQKEAIIKIRVLSKENPENRVWIANSGVIPPLVKLLSYPDLNFQEHTVTALLNLSIDDANKRLIAREGAIPAIIEILQHGTEEAKENSAAALFSLSMLDENKVLIGTLKGIPPLVALLRDGTIRGKKDAATALFNLSMNQANKSRAIKAGIIQPLLFLLQDKNLGMVDEALSILLLLASHPEGRTEIGRNSFIEILVNIIIEGTPKNKECATSLLLELGRNNSPSILVALQFGVYEHLVELTRCGTSRAQRKASSLLQYMSKCEHIP
ncbi:U-box domain-containing protein 15 [Cucurbita argyrosperma subsp. argyrosperma]|uniref:RING-type E3 ubiquitin transferase n=2 Tax=Cucurbita TaxID=3660 RepID=A0A6J1FXC1_CUCMO